MRPRVRLSDDSGSSRRPIRIARIFLAEAVIFGNTDAQRKAIVASEKQGMIAAARHQVCDGSHVRHLDRAWPPVLLVDEAEDPAERIRRAQGEDDLPVRAHQATDDATRLRRPPHVDQEDDIPVSDLRKDGRELAQEVGS